MDACHLSNICCLCWMERNSLCNLSTVENDQISYYNKLTSCVVEMNFEDMSDQYAICKQCCGDINTFYNFRVKCLLGKSAIIEYLTKLRLFSKQLTNNIIESENSSQSSLDQNWRIISSYALENKYGQTFVLPVISETDISNEKKQLELDKCLDNIDVTLIKCENQNETELTDNAKLENASLNITSIVTVTHQKNAHDQNTAEDSSSFDFVDIAEEVTNKIRQEIEDTYIKQSRQRIAITQSSMQQKLHECSDCNQGFNRKYKLMEHAKIHTVTNNYKCDSCNTVFKTKANYQKHVLSHGRIIKCHICDKVFKEQRYLTVHVRNHTGQQPHACFICAKRYNSRQDLSKHLHRHEGVKPFICPVCNKGLSSRAELRRHTRIHTDQKPYRCESCSKSFNDRYNLERHRRTHEGRLFECPLCGKMYYDKGTLERHTRIHTGQKPFACGTCGKRFNGRGDLAKHIRAHTGERPFLCHLCHKTFMGQSDLNRHKKIHLRQESGT